MQAFTSAVKVTQVTACPSTKAVNAMQLWGTLHNNTLSLNHVGFRNPTVVETVSSWPSGLHATLKTVCPMGSSTDSAWMSLISEPVKSSTLALLPPATTADRKHKGS